MTLVKNLNGALPLSKAKVRTVAAVGPHCNATLALQSNYHGTAPYLVSPAAGLAKYASVATELGCAIGQCKGCHPKDSAPEAEQADAGPAEASAAPVGSVLVNHRIRRHRVSMHGVKS